MEKQDIKLNDLHRVLFGNAPPEFLIEVFIRGVFTYLLLLIAFRLMGKRMSSQLSRNELAALVSLAACIGIPLQSPERGIVPCIIAAIIVVSVQNILAYWISINVKVESLTQGATNILVDDGVMKFDAMKKVRISRVRIFSKLRGSGIQHLGEIKRLYMEADGSFSIIKNEHPKAGLSILPSIDPDFLSEQKKDESVYVCDDCGKPRESKQETSCQNCGATHWLPGVVE